MFRHIQPKEYSVDSARGMTDQSELDLSKYEDPQSDHSSEEDMEVEIVQTEQIANQKVFKYYNKALLILITAILAAFAIEILKPVTLQINNKEYNEMSTIYTTRLADEQQEITFLVPNEEITNKEGQQVITAQMCIKHEAYDCWREVLSSQGFMFVQVEKWLINREISGNVMILWEERLALSVLLLALNYKINGRIDVLFTPEHSKTYTDSLQINLQQYQRYQRVSFISKTELVMAELQDYHLVIGNHTVFDQILYPPLLQFAVQSGHHSSFPQMILEFIAKTNLMLFYDAAPSALSKLKLQNIRNQITSIKVSEDYEIMEEAVKDLDQPFYVIVLDRRIKDIIEVKPEQAALIQQELSNPVPSEQDQTANPIVQKLQPLKRVKRIAPQRIDSFFKCGTTNKDSAKIGQFYQTEIRGIQLIKQAGPSSYLNNTHLYNFVMHLLVASEPCSILDLWEDEMLANIAGSVHEGFVFVPDTNRNLQRIKETTYANKLRVNQLNDLRPDTLQEIIISNEIKVSFITWQHFNYMHKEFKTALHSNMNIVMKMEGGEEEQDLLEELLQNFHIFVVSVLREKQYDISCIKNFEVSYYEGKDYPDNSYMFITKQDVLFEDVNPHDFFNTQRSRKFQLQKYPCLRDFTLKEAQNQYNLKKGSRELIIDSKISIFVDGYTEPESVISSIKAQEGINQFLRSVLMAGDKIAVLGSTLQDPYTVANIIWKASGDENEEVYFFNAPSTLQTYTEKLQQLNQFETIVEFMEFDWDSPYFSKIFDLSGISVVLATPELFTKIYDMVEGVQQLLVLLKFEGSSKQLLEMLGHFKEKQQYLVSEVESKANQYNLCLNYDIRRLREVGEETFDNGGWIAFTI